eukprot:2339418-Pyramimonas_sp.AAC.1
MLAFCRLKCASMSGKKNRPFASSISGFRQSWRAFPPRPGSASRTCAPASRSRQEAASLHGRGLHERSLHGRSPRGRSERSAWRLRASARATAGISDSPKLR